MQQMSGRLSADVPLIQRAVVEEVVSDDTDFNTLLLLDAAVRRNPHIIPEDEMVVNLVDISELAQEYSAVFEKLPVIEAQKVDKLADTLVWVIGDFDEKDGHDLLQAVGVAQQGIPGLSVVMLNNPEIVSERPALSTLLYQLNEKGVLNSNELLLQLLKEAPPTRNHLEFPSIGLLTQIDEYQDMKSQSWYFNEHMEAGNFWKSCQAMLEKTGFKPGQRGLVVNGRVSKIPYSPYIMKDFSTSIKICVGCRSYTCERRVQCR